MTSKGKGDGGKRNESPPPKTSSPVKHIAGQKLQSGNKAERTLAASVERHIEPRRPPGKNRYPLVWRWKWDSTAR